MLVAYLLRERQGFLESGPRLYELPLFGSDLAKAFQRVDTVEGIAVAREQAQALASQIARLHVRALGKLEVTQARAGRPPRAASMSSSPPWARPTQGCCAAGSTSWAKAFWVAAPS